MIETPVIISMEILPVKYLGGTIQRLGRFRLDILLSNPFVDQPKNLGGTTKLS